MTNRIPRIAAIAVSMIFFCISAQAKILRQQVSTVSGSVVEAGTGNPVGWATVALLDADGNVVTGIACDGQGHYEFQAESGTYTLRVSMVGYTDALSELTLVPGTNDLPQTVLSPDMQMLSGATVTERVKLVEMKIDKVVMNISQSAFSQGSNAFDLIKKAPGVTIDKDGNIKLNGKSVQVWIDGRPSNVDGKTLESLLRSTNGESIDKFELMEHPSAKYDAAGQGGIINIKTKKSILQGLNGSMGLGGGGMRFAEADETPWQQSCWLNLNNRNKKLSTIFSIYEGFYNTPLSIGNTLSYTLEDGRTFSQDAYSLMKNFYHNYNVKLGADWFVDGKNTVGAILYVPGDRNDLWSRRSSTQLSYDDVPFTDMRTMINNHGSNLQCMGNLNWTHIFDPSKSQEMTVNMDYFRNNGIDRNIQSDTTFLGTPDYVLKSKSISGDRTYNVYSAKFDYQSVIFQRYMFEAGAKYALSSTDNMSREYENDGLMLKNDFVYNEHVAALYATASGQITPRLSAKVGLRGEYTCSAGDWTSDGSKTRRSYFDLFPTVFLGWNPSEKLMLMASYSRRIQRPFYSQLNPTKTYIDARTYTVGNPDIKPQYSNSFTLTANFRQHYSLSLGYDGSSDSITQVPDLDGETAYLKWDNYGRNRMAYLSANISALPVTPWLQWTLNASATYINSTANATGTVRNSLCARAYTSLSFLLPKDWKFDIDGFYMTPMKIDTYTVHANGGANAALKKNLLGNRMTFSIQLVDIFRTSSMNLDLVVDNTRNAASTVLQKYYAQKVLLDLTWNFGTASRGRQRRVGVLDELSRAGSGSLGK